MATQIKAWQVANDVLRPLNTTLEDQGRRETEHLERWIASTSEILGEDLVLIGQQVQTRSGPLDLLALESVLMPSLTIQLVTIQRSAIRRS